MSLYPELSEDAFSKLPALAQGIIKLDREYDKLMSQPVIYFSTIPALKIAIAERNKLIQAAHAVYGKSSTSPAAPSGDKPGAKA